MRDRDGYKLIVGCNYHTSWQSDSRMRFVLIGVSGNKAELKTRSTKKRFLTNTNSLIFIKTNYNINKAKEILKKLNKMENLKIKIDQRRPDKHRIKAFLDNVKATCENFLEPPSFDFFVDIIGQVLIHEGLEEQFKVETNKTAKIVFLKNSNNGDIAATINY